MERKEENATVSVVVKEEPMDESGIEDAPSVQETTPVSFVPRLKHTWAWCPRARIENEELPSSREELRTSLVSFNPVFSLQSSNFIVTETGETAKKSSPGSAPAKDAVIVTFSAHEELKRLCSLAELVKTSLGSKSVSSAGSSTTPSSSSPENKAKHALVFSRPSVATISSTTSSVASVPMCVVASAELPVPRSTASVIMPDMEGSMSVAPSSVTRSAPPPPSSHPTPLQPHQQQQPNAAQPTFGRCVLIFKLFPVYLDFKRDTGYHSLFLIRLFSVNKFRCNSGISLILTYLQ